MCETIHWCTFQNEFGTKLQVVAYIRPKVELRTTNFIDHQNHLILVWKKYTDILDSMWILWHNHHRRGPYTLTYNVDFIQLIFHCKIILSLFDEEPELNLTKQKVSLWKLSEWIWDNSDMDIFLCQFHDITNLIHSANQFNEQLRWCHQGLYNNNRIYLTFVTIRFYLIHCQQWVNKLFECTRQQPTPLLFQC